jgi:hypothetical protein
MNIKLRFRNSGTSSFFKCQEKIRTLSRKAKLEVAAVIRAIPEQPLQSMAEGWRG